MRLSQRLIAATVLAALSGVLGGCGTNGAFDPTDMLDFLDTKKKLPGERKPVFPEGVPGVEQGVPKELYKGAQQQDAAPPVAAAPEPPPSKRGTKSAARTPPPRWPPRRRSGRRADVPSRSAPGRARRDAAAPRQS